MRLNHKQSGGSTAKSAKFGGTVALRSSAGRVALRSPAGRMRRGFWFAPAAAGLLLITMGVLIWFQPQLLAYFVAGAFVFGGVVLLSVGLNMRTRVVYRRIDLHGASGEQ